MPDTNVLVAAAITPRGLCGRLLDAAIDGHWQLVASPQLLANAADIVALISGDPDLTELADFDPPVLTPAAFLHRLQA